MTTVCIDASVLVALADAHDKWHTRATEIRDAMLAAPVQVVYFDCVLNEAIGVIGRRSEEQARSDQFERLLDHLLLVVPVPSITWISASAQRLFSSIVSLCREHEGRLNYHDALIALACQELKIGAIVSFDGDFDRLDWLTRLSAPQHISASQA